MDTSHDLERVTGVERLAGRLFLWLARFRAVGQVPAGRKFVVVAAPHTSNWDFPLALAFGYARDVRLRVMIKHTLFVGPLGWFLRAVGGVPIDRRAPQGLVRQMSDAFRTTERLALVVPPSGTRARAPHWKSGFYHIAREAGVPIVCCFIDFPRREVGIYEAYALTGDLPTDMDHLRAVYAATGALHPEDVTPVRLREEDTSPAGASRSGSQSPADPGRV